MWVIVAFIDAILAAVPISWVINCNGQKKCFWPFQDERIKRLKCVPPSFGTDDVWDLHDCVILLNGAIYDDFEEALAIEMEGIDIVVNANANERPKLSWKDEENEIERKITENTETVNQSEDSILNEYSFSEFHEFLNRPDLCSTRNEAPPLESNITEKEALPSNEMHQSYTEMLDKILENQEEKRNILVKLMTRMHMYALESAIEYNSD